jgi:hypothetical protein
MLTPCLDASFCRTLSHSCLIRKVLVMVFLRVSLRVELLKADQPLCNMPNKLCLISVLSLKIELALKPQIHFQSIQNEQSIEKESGVQSRTRVYYV